MPGVIVVGAQWGDEGKGKVIDLLSKNASHVVRAQGGNNAGHTVLIGETEYRLHLVPSGILFPHTQCYIGGGTVIDPEMLIAEIEMLQKMGIKLEGRLGISQFAHVILPYHKLLDGLVEERKKERAIGTTRKGIGPCYADKVGRIGLRIAELVHPEILASALKKNLDIKNEELRAIWNHPPLDFNEIFEKYRKLGEQVLPFVEAVETIIYEALKSSRHVIFEGAQGTFLDVTFGTYPYVTSSSTIAGGICSGAGIGPTQIDCTLGVVKAYTTRVGHGPLVTEMKDPLFDPHEAREVGTTTGRIRRIGWFDAPLVRHAIRLNGINGIALMKLDVLDSLDQIPICTGYLLRGRVLKDFPALQADFENIEPQYEILQGWKSSTKEAKSIKDLPQKAVQYIKRLEDLCGVPIHLISVGPKREETLILKDVFC